MRRNVWARTIVDVVHRLHVKWVNTGAMKYNFPLFVMCASVLVLGCSGSDEPKDVIDTQPLNRSVELTDVPEGSDSPTLTLAEQRERLVDECNRLVEQGRPAEAKSKYREWLVGHPMDAVIIFRLAGEYAGDGNLDEAISLLDEIPLSHPETGIAAMGQSADWCFELQRYGQAEERYRKVLEVVPEAVPALRQLAFLLNRQGRRQEASDYVRRLCRIGDVKQDELHSLIAISDAMYDSPEETETNALGPVLYTPIGNSGEARKRFADADYVGVVELLKPEIELQQAPSEIVALFGRAATEAQIPAEINWWRELITEDLLVYGDYWAAIGTHELAQRRYKTAIGALGQAILRNPTDLASISRMRQAFEALGKEAEAQLWFERWTQVRATVEANNEVAKSASPSPQSVARLIDGLDQIGRKLEAVLWGAIELQATGGTSQAIRALQEKHSSVIQGGKLFPGKSDYWCGIEMESYPIPTFETARRALSNGVQPVSVARPTSGLYSAPLFRNASLDLGLEHTYRVSEVPLSERYTIFQTLGGGVAVLDFDLDGNADLFLAQGAADAPDFNGDLSDMLYRNLSNGMAEVTQAAATSDFGYTIGVTAGDWNQDGFADLAIANIGGVILFTNHGDGTFKRRVLTASGNLNRVPSSLALADLTGDQLPDLVALGYVEDGNIVSQPPVDAAGRVKITIAPGSFDASEDYLFSFNQDGSGSVRVLDQGTDPRPGLGLIVSNFDQQNGNELYVGNDSKPNRLWRGFAESQLQDLANAMGCSHGFSGGATGAMGIAAADFNGDQTLDLYVANYENEDANFYLRLGDAFQDRTRQYQLAGPSRDVVGFGAQAIDYENDGDKDVVVTNGHLDNALSIRGSHAHPLQFFVNRGDRFVLSDRGTGNAYSAIDHFGRALALADFNRDGLVDFVITHVEERTALLVNETKSSHHWIQVALVGVEDERDAIGSRVEVITDDGTFTQWMTAGDGYLARNEKVLFFGVGGCEGIVGLTITWPSGQRQSIGSIPMDCRVQVTQSRDEVYILP